jgi:hypothetical protein
VIGDLASAAQTRSLAEQVNKLGRMDAVIHNAGIFREPARGNTPEGHAKVLAVQRARALHAHRAHQRPRPAGLSQQQHASRREGSLDDIDWSKRSWDTVSRVIREQAVRHRAGVRESHANGPACRATRSIRLGADQMGGRGAPDDLEQGHLTQTWLAASDDPAAKSSGGLWYHRKRQEAGRPQSLDLRFQDDCSPGSRP